MENNWSKHFMYNDSVDQYTQTATTLFRVLEQPKVFMLESSITEDDLKNGKQAVLKLVSWLRTNIE